jgi:glyoxylase-like metal-dependent hydrolase (beta-lactamase superfamily II)
MVIARDFTSTMLETPRLIPDLGIPILPETVDVRIINTTCYQRTNTTQLLGKPIPGHETITFPTYAFLISNRSLGVNVLFDLGMRRDWRKACPPALLPYIGDDGKGQPLQIDVDRDVVDIIDEDPGNIGITSDDIAAVIWSHHHFDHRGDMARFSSHTKLIVGPGLMHTYLHSEVHESEIRGREVIELEDSQFSLNIGGFAAHDAFGDGSLYLLSSPGHTVGHLCALARTTSSPSSTYAFLGGDCAYHCGEFRPSPFIPLPQQVSFKSASWHFPRGPQACPPVLKNRKILLCAGEFIKDIVHPYKSAIEPFYDTPSEPIVCNRGDATVSTAKMEIFDAHDDVLVCISHDKSLMNHLPFYPHTMNDWHKKGCKQKLHWEFLNDFDLDRNPISPPAAYRFR